MTFDRPAPPLHLLRLFALGVAATVALAFTAFTWWDYRSAYAEARSDLAEVARLMEEHTRAAMLASSLQLNRVADLVATRRVGDLRGSERDWRALQKIMADIPQADSIWVFDKDADLVLSTLGPGGPPLNVADRAYFSEVKAGARLFISPRIWGKIYGGFYFAMSRPLESAGGRFEGVVQFSLKESYFLDFYRTLRPGDGASFTILKTDGTLVTRYPDTEPGAPSPTHHLVVAKLSESNVGSFTARSPYDGVERLYAFRRVVGHPLAVVTGLPTKVVVAGWQARTLRNAMLAATVLGAFLAIAWQLEKAIRREQKARRHAQALLADKDVLFQEIHHRVKNNLQIISSFLTMQALKTPDPASAEAVREALNRIHSMGLVHQVLYEQNEAAEVSMDAYLRALADSAAQSHGADARGISITVETDGTRLPLDCAVPLALLANEALTNAVKHAFPDRGGTIEMRLHRRPDDNRLTFAISDDGVGMPEEGNRPANGLGMHILRSLARQLDAELSVQSGPGTTIEARIPG